MLNILDSFNSLSMSDGNFTNTLKRQFPKLTKASSSSENASPVLPEKNKKSFSRTTSNTSSPSKDDNVELADSNTSISSITDPSTPYDEEYSHSYCGPFGEMSTRMSSLSSLKESKTTVLTSSTMAMEDAFFERSMSMSKDSVHRIPFDFNIAYHGCDPINLRKALEMPSTETTL